jgi:hypothetical protein
MRRIVGFRAPPDLVHMSLCMYVYGQSLGVAHEEGGLGLVYPPTQALKAREGKVRLPSEAQLHSAFSSYSSMSQKEDGP